MQSLSANVPFDIVDDMSAGSSQKARASTFLLTSSRASSLTWASAGCTLKHTMPGDVGLSVSRTALFRMCSSVRAASSNPFEMARRNAAIPNA